MMREWQSDFVPDAIVNSRLWTIITCPHLEYYNFYHTHGFLTPSYPQIKAFGLNRMDIMQREGKYPVPKGASNILGVEFSGHVSELGNGVSEWKEGDEVLGLAGGVSVALLRIQLESIAEGPCFLPKQCYSGSFQMLTNQTT